MNNTNSHTLECRIVEVSEIVLRGKDGSFKIRYILVETNEGDYSQKIKMECSGKNVDAIPVSWKDQDAIIEFNLNGFEWEGKNYVTLRVWKAELMNEPSEILSEPSEITESISVPKENNSKNILPF